MIVWTTPTAPIIVSSGQLEKTKCNVYVTFFQGDNVMTLTPRYIESNESTDRTLLVVNLSQLETGGFSPGITGVQVNIVDWSGYRAATEIDYVCLGSNAIRKELAHV